MKPILFNTEMVKAILDGRKTQTRRVCGFNILDDDNHFGCDKKGFRKLSSDDTFACPNCGGMQFKKYQPKYKVGDVLWVREPAKVMSPPVETCRKLTFKYLADNKTTDIYLDDNFDYSKKWIQRCQGVPNGCIKLMARIFLKVTNVGVERLQDILVGDIIAEGYYNPDCTNHSRPHYFAEMAKKWWANLWNSTAKDGYKWEDNPYVFVYEFERIENKDLERLR